MARGSEKCVIAFAVKTYEIYEEILANFIFIVLLGFDANLISIE